MRPSPRFVRNGIGVALVLQDVHLDQYHWKLSKQIIDRAKKNPEPAHRPTDQPNEPNEALHHAYGGGREEKRTIERKREREGKRERDCPPRGKKERDKKRIKK